MCQGNPACTARNVTDSLTRRLGLLMLLYFSCVVPCALGNVVQPQRQLGVEARGESDMCAYIDSSNIDPMLKPAVCIETHQCHWDATDASCLSGYIADDTEYTDEEKTSICASIAVSDLTVANQTDVCEHISFCSWFLHGDHGHCEFGDHHDDSVPVGHLVGAGIVILLVGALGAFMPLYIRRSGTGLIYFANAFGCGALLAFGMVHLLPEAVLFTTEADQVITVGKSAMSLAYVLCLAGFILAAILDTTGERLGSRAHGSEDVESAEGASSLSSSVNIASKTADIAVGVSLALHSLFEGLIVGTSHSVMLVWVSTMAIVFHKWAAGMALGQALVNRGHSNRFLIGSLVLFVVASPVGVLIGGLATVGGESVIGIVNSLCAGLVIHLGVHLIDSTFSSAKSTTKFVLGWLMAVIAAGIVVGLMILHLSQHNHSHEHSH